MAARGTHLLHQFFCHKSPAAPVASWTPARGDLRPARLAGRAPPMLGCDIRRLSPQTQAYLSNPELIVSPLPVCRVQLVQQGKIHRVDPKSQVDLEVRLNIPIRALELTQILGQPCELQVNSENVHRGLSAGRWSGGQPGRVGYPGLPRGHGRRLPDLRQAAQRRRASARGGSVVLLRHAMNIVVGLRWRISIY